MSSICTEYMEVSDFETGEITRYEIVDDPNAHDVRAHRLFRLAPVVIAWQMQQELARKARQAEGGR